MLQGFLGDEPEIPGRGIVLGVVEPGGIYEVGVLTAQDRCLSVHLLHEGADRAGDRLRQDGACLVGGDDEKTLQKLAYRQYLSSLDVGGGAVVWESFESGLAGGDALIHAEFPLVHRPEHQQRRHDLGEAGGVELLVLILAVDDLTGILIHQQRGLGFDIQGGQRLLLRRSGQGAEGQKQHRAEKSGKKASESHIHLSRSVV